jgi:lipid-A-disaccharide synthase
MDKEVVRELIQNECTSEAIKMELSYILEGGKNRNRMLDEYQEMKKILGEGGASKKVAQLMLKTIQE